ncbi:hypothetical protein PR003_g11106 [Phytophthora rubi]|uniref:Uncharacterized protein n=2 Tax=Phytophthora TaxID=4783 RepID=A0A6A4FDH0_9STRA|nr:hypothetical protein PR002_g10765 [Phytophthora rubi]KAE9032165.1 hypothetical protein PR001_g10730 [Phytophthora rubi]KAE9312850.1 hypothetical protein PF008_g19875 [Phytophthora fragariae]KAE9339244.1 hypothetical protein PR003_g11106 [Phytophthora rubi]
MAVPVTLVCEIYTKRCCFALLLLAGTAAVGAPHRWGKSKCTVRVEGDPVNRCEAGGRPRSGKRIDLLCVAASARPNLPGTTSDLPGGGTCSGSSSTEEERARWFQRS